LLEGTTHLPKKSSPLFPRNNPPPEKKWPIVHMKCMLDDLVKILGSHINEINKYLDVLESEGKIKTMRQERGIFYQIANKA